MKDGKEDGEKKKARKTEINFVLLILFVVGVLAFLIFGFKLLSKPKMVSIDEMHALNLRGELAPDKGYMYNGFSFVYYNGIWFTKVHDSGSNVVSNVQLHYGPKQVENITVEGDPMLLSEYNGTYITFDPLGVNLPYVALASSELSIHLANVLKMNPVAACTKNETGACSDRPIINCENNDQNPVISIEESPKTAIIQDSNCIRVRGMGPGMVMSVDKLLLMWMGVIR